MPTSKGRGGWSWMRAVGYRHDQPCQEREDLAASLSAHTTTRPQGRLMCHSVAVGVVPDAGLEPARPKATELEPVAPTNFANRGDPDFWGETGNPQAKPPRRAPTQGVPPGGIEPPSQRLKGARSATELEKHDRPTYPSGRLGSTQGRLSVGRNLCPVLPDPGNWPTATECSCGLVVGVSALCEYRLTRPGLWCAGEP